MQDDINEEDSQDKQEFEKLFDNFKDEAFDDLINKIDII